MKDNQRYSTTVFSLRSEKKTAMENKQVFYSFLSKGEDSYQRWALSMEPINNIRAIIINRPVVLR